MCAFAMNRPGVHGDVGLGARAQLDQELVRLVGVTRRRSRAWQSTPRRPRRTTSGGRPRPSRTSPPCSSARKGPTRRASDHSRTGNASDACPAPSAPGAGSTRFGDWKSDGSTQLGGFDHPGITFPARSTSRRTPARSSGGWRSAREAWRGVRSARQELRARPASLLGRAGLRARCYPVRPLQVDCARVGLRVSQSSCGAVRYVLDKSDRSVGYSRSRRGTS